MYTACIHVQRIAKELLNMRPPVIFRLDDDEYDAYATAAALAGVSVNQYIKERVRELRAGTDQQLVLQELQAIRAAVEDPPIPPAMFQGGGIEPGLLMEAVLLLRGMARPELAKAVQGELKRRGIDHHDE